MKTLRLREVKSFAQEQTIRKMAEAGFELRPHLLPQVRRPAQQGFLSREGSSGRRKGSEAGSGARLTLPPEKRPLMGAAMLMLWDPPPPPQLIGGEPGHLTQAKPIRFLTPPPQRSHSCIFDMEGSRAGIKALVSQQCDLRQLGPLCGLVSFSGSRKDESSAFLHGLCGIMRNPGGFLPKS